MQHDKRSHGLDTLRGVAVVSVLIFHYLNNTSVLRTNSLLPLQAASEHLFFGVDLFFVLSGYFIGASLMRSRATRSYLSIYAFHRMARILPLYLLWLEIFCIFLLLKADVRFGGAFPWLMDMGGVPLVSYFTFTQNWASSAFGRWGPAWLGITWTLAFEMQFYLIAAVVVLFVPVRYMGLAALAVIAASLAFKQLATVSGHSMMVMTPSRLDSPFVGVLCAWLVRFEGVVVFLARYRLHLTAAASLLLLAHYANSILQLQSWPIDAFAQNAVVFGLATLAFSPPVGSQCNFIVAALRWCGVRCYGIYIMHVGVLGIVSHLMFNWPPNVFPPGVGWPAVGVAFVITLALAAASWRLLEAPFIKWAQEYGARRRQECVGKPAFG